MADTDMQKMQEEAMQRAREMQRRSVIPPPQTRQDTSSGPAEKMHPQNSGQNSRGRIPQAANPVQHSGQASPGAHRTPATPPVHMPEEEEPLSPPPSALESLFQDHEKTLILMLLLLIGTGEGQNHEITLALLHLLM